MQRRKAVTLHPRWGCPSPVLKSYRYRTTLDPTGWLSLAGFSILFLGQPGKAPTKATYLGRSRPNKAVQPPASRNFKRSGGKSLLRLAVTRLGREKPGLQPAPLSCEEGGREGPHGVTSPGLTPYYVYKGPARPCYVYKVQLDQVFISRLPCASKG